MAALFFNKIRLYYQSLAGKLLLRFLICLCLFFFLIGSIQFFSLRYILHQNVKDNLASEFQSLKNTFQSWVVLKELPPKRFEELNKGHFAALYTTDYQLLSYVLSYGNATMPPNFKDLSHNLRSLGQKDLQQFFSSENQDGRQFMLMVTPVYQMEWHLNTQSTSPLVKGMHRYFGMGPYRPQISGKGLTGFLVMGAPLEREGIILRQNIRGFTFTALLVLLLGSLITAYVLRKPLNPLLSIAGTARKIAGGQYDLRLSPEKSSTEIDQLKNTLNHMLEQLETALTIERNAKDRMARFIADASHELRTPLTSLRGYLEILQRSGKNSQEDLNLAHHTMLVETERLIRLTEGLLTLNRLAQKEGRGLALETVTFKHILPELDPLLAPLLKQRTFTINARSLDDYLQIGSDYELPLSADELKQVLYNLLTNAVQHTEENGTIAITVTENTKHIQLSLKDNGKGIPPEDLPHIFDRFFRGEKSRTRKQGEGAGLGLAIVAEIIQLRGGEISVNSEIGKGTTFVIHFNKS